MMNKKLRLAYLAGLVDGEGSLTISKCGAARLTVYNTNLELLGWARQHFGGSVHCYQRLSNPNWKPLGRWVLGNVATAELLKKLVPYLIAKREQANLLIQFQVTKIAATEGRKLGIPIDVVHHRERLRVKLSKLNN